MMEKIQAWLVRDKDKGGHRYGVYFQKYRPSRYRLCRTEWNGNITWHHVELVLCTKDFHRLQPDIRLRPGGGAMPIEIEIKLRKEQ
jgi:hypothetical protein